MNRRVSVNSYSPLLVPRLNSSSSHNQIIMLNSSSKITQEYSQIPSTEETEPPNPPRRSHIPLLSSLFCILLGISIGITLGFALKPSSKHASSLVPLEISRNRKPVAFFPDPRYVGGTDEVHQNWRNLVKGIVPTPK